MATRAHHRIRRFRNCIRRQNRLMGLSQFCLFSHLSPAGCIIAHILLGADSILFLPSHSIYFSDLFSRVCVWEEREEKKGRQGPPQKKKKKESRWRNDEKTTRVSSGWSFYLFSLFLRQVDMCVYIYSPLSAFLPFYMDSFFGFIRFDQSDTVFLKYVRDDIFLCVCRIIRPLFPIAHAWKAPKCYFQLYSALIGCDTTAIHQSPFFSLFFFLTNKIE